MTYSNNTVTETNAAGKPETYHFSDAYVTEHNIASLLDTYICYNGNSGESSCVDPLDQQRTRHNRNPNRRVFFCG